MTPHTLHVHVCAWGLDILTHSYIHYTRTQPKKHLKSVLNYVHLNHYFDICPNYIKGKVLGFLQIFGYNLRVVLIIKSHFAVWKTLQ